MSGQPVNTPTEVKEFRKAYMATLKLQEELTKKNYDANVLYKRTGVVPTQILDYRSTTEKMADLLQLRILLRSKLRQIADAQNAEDIVNQLSAPQVGFVSQRIEAIIREVKPKYKFGIPADLFMSYITELERKEQYDLLKVNNLLNPEEEEVTAEAYQVFDASPAKRAELQAKGPPQLPERGRLETYDEYKRTVMEYFDTFGKKPTRQGRSRQALQDVVKKYETDGLIPVFRNTGLSLAFLKQKIFENVDTILGAYGHSPPSTGNPEGDRPTPQKARPEEVFDDTGGRAEQKAEGEGMRRRKGRGIAKGVDYAKGIDPLQKFAPLGQYYINQHKLRDDILTCCRATGKNLTEWKARRVSVSLANLVRKLVNKGTPTFDDFNSLSEEDKHILAEFVRKVKIDLEVPSSGIDREDLNQFEIMKGQIMAGNDSAEMIKKFKLLIVKLAYMGRLPKGQSKEMLMELAMLGY
jgi:hypothetical protein